MTTRNSVLQISIVRDQGGLPVGHTWSTVSHFRSCSSKAHAQVQLIHQTCIVLNVICQVHYLPRQLSIGCTSFFVAYLLTEIAINFVLLLMQLHHDRLTCCGEGSPRLTMLVLYSRSPAFDIPRRKGIEHLWQQQEPGETLSTEPSALDRQVWTP